ncbi:MAG: manganese efflux pump MntP family protein [Treponema sp.]|jgi:putative Mn2+ efflux pump MntP|nr:manganese efflux pump MntP family protein [Treponema sp.]
MLEIFLIGLALSMDAFAVSVSSGISIRDLKPFHAIRASFSFGVFQFIMPVSGWFLGGAFTRYISAFDHWIAFLLLAFTGGKMIFEAHKGREKTENGGGKDAPGGYAREEKNTADIRSPAALLALSLATSIDALAVGVSFSIMQSGIWGRAALIGIITFFVCLAGFAFGRRVGFLFEKWAETAGGVILVTIGVKMLAEHLLAG